MWFKDRIYMYRVAYMRFTNTKLIYKAEQSADTLMTSFLLEL